MWSSPLFTHPRHDSARLATTLLILVFQLPTTIAHNRWFPWGVNSCLASHPVRKSRWMFTIASRPNPWLHISVLAQFGSYSKVFIRFFFLLRTFGSPFTCLLILLSFHSFSLLFVLLSTVYVPGKVLFWFVFSRILAFSVFKLLAYEVNLTTVKPKLINSHQLK